MARLHHLSATASTQFPYDIDVVLEQLEAVARMYYLWGDRQSVIAERLQKRFPERHFRQDSVSKYLKVCREAGIVSFTVDRFAGISGERIDDASRELAQAFGLDKCDVIRVTPPRFGPQSKVDVSGIKKAEVELKQFSDSYVHYGLAHFTAQRAVDNFHHHEHIALGGGRAINRFARYLSRHPQETDGVRITPLSGRVWSGSWVLEAADRFQLLERPLDPDDNAQLLASAFEQSKGASYSQIGHILYAESPTQADQIIRSHCFALPGGRWRLKQRPTKAYIGIGALDKETGHRVRIFLDRFDKDRAPQAPYLASVRQELAEALSIVGDTKRFPQKLPWFGDIANKFFPALPLPEQIERAAFVHDRLLRSQFTKLKSLLDRVNAKAVSMEWEHLKSIPSVRVIAGGTAKLHCLWTALLPGVFDREDKTEKRIISELSIDRETAEKLLMIYNKYRDSDTAQRWYRKTFESLKMFTSEPIRPQ